MKGATGFLTAFAVFVASVAPAFGGGELFVSASACKTPNCAALVLGGSIKDFKPSAGKWVGEVYADIGDCLRLDVLKEQTDLQMVLVAPNGAVFKGDNRAGGACPQCPLITVAQTPNDGWYTVSIGTKGGVPQSENFTLAYGRYTPKNPNCPAAKSSAATDFETGASPGAMPQGGRDPGRMQ